ncbi:hypothetical protein [Paenibacillus turpanensis]|uniref:hypothetical protein n=1 Tax=Paenibacillus turpanensis TaxID=2689078 RepID=UPI00140934EB|nr:hypothetical protein [Paenibacillus turpanensis]
MSENKVHRGNYTGTTNMNAENQDMAFVNDTVEAADTVTSFNNVPDNDNAEQNKNQEK